MKKLFILAAVFITVLGGCTSASQQDCDRAEALRNRILEGKTDKVLVVAHRGDWRFAPENSIAAIEHSIAVGVDIVELDLQMTKDSVLIVMHDGT
ncbi:MAG: glycerophosphodiester phosphodiesterase family protein, partial [Candidatus Cryptobacteroides sp.]